MLRRLWREIKIIIIHLDFGSASDKQRYVKVDDIPFAEWLSEMMTDLPTISAEKDVAHLQLFAAQ